MAKKGGSNLASQLAEKPTGVKVAILAGVMAAMGFLYWQFFYSSLSEERDNLKAAYNRLEADNANLKKRLQQWEQLVKDKEEIDQMLKKGSVSLPPTADLPSFIGHLQRQAASAGVSFKNWKRLPEANAGTYTRVPVEVSIEGSYFQIMKYMKLLFETKRIITVENFTLKSKADDRDEARLSGTFRATTFRQPDDETETKKGPGAPGAPKKAEAEGGLRNNDMVKDAEKARDRRQGDLDQSAGTTTDEAPGAPDTAEAGASGLDRLKSPGAP